MNGGRLACGVLLLCCVTAARAQSSVSLYGVVDGGLRFLTNASASGGNQLTMQSNGYHNNNRFDIAGKEDLGDGLHAHFLLESGFMLSNGALDNTTAQIFQRQAFVGLDNQYGSLDLGRQWTTAHDIIEPFDPFGLTYTPILPLSAASDGTRVSNDVKYHGHFGGLSVVADNSFGGVAGSANDGSSRAIGLRYAWQRFSIGAAYGYRNLAAKNGSFGGDNFYMAGAYYDVLPLLRVAGGYIREEQEPVAAQPSLRTENIWGGLSWQAAPQLTVQAAHYQTNVRMGTFPYGKHISMVGLTYLLSVRTSLYAEVDYTRYQGHGITSINASGQQQQFGTTVGIVHHF
ncbi:MAG TPA: porin [Paraburkholderia sp.]|jgi:predicted porin|nr:porin [Paraburkholderia sp.]